MSQKSPTITSLPSLPITPRDKTFHCLINKPAHAAAQKTQQQQQRGGNWAAIGIHPRFIYPNTQRLGTPTRDLLNRILDILPSIMTHLAAMTPVERPCRE